MTTSLFFRLRREQIIVALISLISKHLNRVLSTVPALMPVPGEAGFNKTVMPL